MKKKISTLLFILPWFSIAPFAQLGGNAGKINTANMVNDQEKIDVKHITLDLRFDWIKKQAYGSAEIKLSLLKDADVVTLDAGMISISSISLNNERLLPFKYDSLAKNTNLAIELDRLHHSGGELTLKIAYHTNWINKTDPNNIWGSNGMGIRFFEPGYTEPKRRRQIWSSGEPESNRLWFPCHDVQYDLRTTDILLTVEEPFMAISNGKLVGKRTNADSSTTFHYKMDQPYPNAQTSVVVGEYIPVKQMYQDIQLNSFGYPDEVEAVSASVERLPDMVKFYAEYTTVKYPYDNYSQVFVQEIPAWIGNAAFSTISENMVDDFSTHRDFLYLWDVVEGESLAHQWFGSLIAVKNWKDIWLSKGFARYFSELYDEYKNGRDEFLLYQRSFDIGSCLGDWNAGIRQPIVSSDDETALSSISGNFPYLRAAAVLHMLRKQLGESRWQKTIRHYVRSNAGKVVVTADFKKAVKEAAGEDMDWFFDQWLFKTGHPVFEISKQYNTRLKELKITVKQVQQIDTAGRGLHAGFFKGKVDIEVNGIIKQLWLEAKPENTFIIKTAVKPALVNFDYESAWIKELKFEKQLDELLYQFQNGRDITGRSWAMNELAVLAGKLTTTAETKARIYNAFRKVILGNSYWRFRASAVARLQNLLATASGKDPLVLDDLTAAMLLRVIKTEKYWLKNAALRFLGITKDKKYADTYLSCLYDSSDRVVNSAAIALGMCGSEKAFNALINLKNKPSWKNQSLISALNGLKELGDERAIPFAMAALTDNGSPHWTLATPVWDHRLAAAETLVSLGRTGEAYPLIFRQFKMAIEENNINDIFYNVQQVATLGEARGTEVFEILRIKFKEDANAMLAVNQYEQQFNDTIKRRQPVEVPAK